MKKNHSRIFTGLFPFLKSKLILLKVLGQQSTKKYLLRYGFIFLLAQLVILIFAITQVYTDATNIAQKEAEKKMEYRHWIIVAKEYPNSPDVLYNAAVASLKLGQKKQALSYIDKSLEIDPNFQDAQNLMREIEK